MRALRIDPEKLRYRAMIGTGGIGSGSFFRLSGNHTIGREESRGGRFLDQRDYCKLHIISHYVATLLGDPFRTIPIGRVGDDEVGKKLLSEMAEAGMDLRYVRSSPNHQTLFSFCFLYPDGSGGNLTTEDSASSYVDPALIMEAEPEFSHSPALVLAAPEVPLDAREAILSLGTRHGLLRVAAFTTEEMQTALDSGMLAKVDLLGINIDEAAAVAGASGASEGLSPADIVQAAVGQLQRVKPDIIATITAGEDGSWCWDGASLCHRPRCSARVASTAGAGDAHLAGMIVGLAVGLSPGEAHELAVLLAGLSVTSPHTIHPEVDRMSLRTFAADCGAQLSERVRSLMEA